MKAAARIDVVEGNPLAPQPFVWTDVAICLHEAIRAAGYAGEHRVDRSVSSIGLELGTHRVMLDAKQLARVLPLVPCPRFALPGSAAKTVDVLVVGTMSERRVRVLRELRAMGLKVETVAGVYGPDLVPALRRARVVLHVHRDEDMRFPVERVLRPVMMNVPVVCETSVFAEHNDWSHSGIVFASLDHLAETCRELVESPERIVARVRVSREFVGHIDFRTPLEQLLRSVGSTPQRTAVEPAPHDDGLLSDAEIEAILAEEGATPPEAGQAAPKLDMVRREPGQGHFGKWMAWLLIFFMVAGAVKSYWF